MLAGLLAWLRPGLADGLETLLVIEPTREYPRHSEGDVVELKDGRLGLIYTRFTGGGADNAAADLVMQMADPAGRTWGEPRMLVPRGDAQNVMSVSTVQLESGEWLLFYLRRGAGWNDCQLLVRRTSNEFESLSDPIRATVTNGYHVVNNDRVIRLSTGRLIFPAALHPCPDGTHKTWSPRAACFAYMSDDEGRTWRRQSGPGVEDRRATIPPRDGVATLSASAPASTTPVTFQEPGIVELSDGRLMMWIRTNERTQYQCFSSDGGEHWTRAEPGPLISARLSPASIQRIPWSGDLVAVWNDHAALKGGPTNRRTPLCVAFSKNDGRDWSPSRPIETLADGWYCYTSISFIHQRILLSYCAGDKKVGGLNRLKVAALREAELR